jgi:hypothetical protein
MLPDWFTKPETRFWMIMWLTSPFFSWWVSKEAPRVETWYASRSEASARANLARLHKALDNPPTLIQSVAIIICFLPIPIVLTTALLVVYFFPIPPPHLLLDPVLGQKIAVTFLTVLFFVNYLLFAILAFHGIQVVYRLRHGEAHYGDNYRVGIQKRIDRLKQKFPRL